MSKWHGPYAVNVAEGYWRPEYTHWDITHFTELRAGAGMMGKPGFNAGPDFRYWFYGPDQAISYKTDGSPPDYYHNVIKGVDVECWDILDSTGLKNHYYIASAFAYLWRCLKKENTLKDLVKARNFLNKEIADRTAKGE